MIGTNIVKNYRRHGRFSIFGRHIIVASRYLSIQEDRIGAKSSSSFGAKLSLYAELSKFRLSSLVVLTTAAGFMCAGSPIDWQTMAATCSATALCAASANTFNQVIEKDLDIKMNRTRNRPLPSGRVSTEEALAVAVAAGSVGTVVLYSAANPIVAALGAANIFLYAGPYTLFKQRSEINTWIGSVVGAIPPVMGWAAATGGSIFSIEPLALATLLYLWQFPHFFALSWMHREDYARGGFQMVAVNDPSGSRTAQLIMKYSLYLTALPLASSALGITSVMFAVEGTAANAYLLYLANNFKDKHSNANARKVFLCSLWYLPLLMFGFVFHNRLWNDNEQSDKLSETVAAIRDRLRSVCVHDVIVHKTAGVHQNLCPKIASDQLSEATVQGAARELEAVEAAAVSATAAISTSSGSSQK